MARISMTKLNDLKKGGSGKGGLKCRRTSGKRLKIKKEKGKQKSQPAMASPPRKQKSRPVSPSPPKRSKYGYTSNFKKGPGKFVKGGPRITPRQLKEMQDDHHKALGEMAKEKANPGPRRSGRMRKRRNRLVESGY